MGDITLGLSPQDPFLDEEEMEVEVFATQGDNLPLESPSDQALRDLADDRWPSQGPPEDALLGPSQVSCRAQ